MKCSYCGEDFDECDLFSSLEREPNEKECWFCSDCWEEYRVNLEIDHWESRCGEYDYLNEE